MRLNPDIAGTTRAPRCIVRLGPWGDLVTMPGWVSAEVVNNNMSSADTFDVAFATSELPKAYGPRWFSKQKDMYLEVWAGLPSDPSNFSTSDLKKLIFGQVDHIEWSPSSAQINVSGRDLTRIFIDTKTTEKFRDMTSSQIVEMMAKRHGLTPVVAKTTGLAGNFFNADKVVMTDERTEWDLLLYLANVEGYAVWVEDQSLYFQPNPFDDVEALKKNPYVIDWSQSDRGGPPTSNVQDLHFRRSLTVARGIQVVIRSWHLDYGKAFEVSYPGDAKGVRVGKATPFGGAQVYRLRIPNLTTEQALKKARELYDQIVYNEKRLEAEMPADTILNTQTMIEVIGTETDYDQHYFVDSITRRMDWDGGFTANVSAKNHAAESQGVGL